MNAAVKHAASFPRASDSIIHDDAVDESLRCLHYARPCDLDKITRQQESHPPFTGTNLLALDHVEAPKSAESGSDRHQVESR